MNQESSHQTVPQPWNSTKNPESKGFVNGGAKDATNKGDYIKKICMNVTLDWISGTCDVFGVKASYYN